MDIWREQDYVERFNAEYSLPPKDIEEYRALLQLKKDDVFVDFGCGNGDLLLGCADSIGYGLGVDLSPFQIGAFKSSNHYKHIECAQCSFLEFEDRGRKFDKAFAGFSLHHISDADKVSFFRGLKGCFSANAIFLIHDMMFDFPKVELGCRFDSLVGEAEEHFGSRWDKKKDDIVNTWLHEYPTDIHVLEDLVGYAGFKVVAYRGVTSFLGMLLCVNGSDASQYSTVEGLWNGTESQNSNND
jgi:SAM-dependent methyltransferase